MAVDYSTDVGKVRALIPDTEEVDWQDDGTASYLFEDAHLEALLELNQGRPKLAAADACEAVGMSEALISKVITTEDLQTDGAKVAQAFLARARQLRDSARDDEAESAFGYARVVRFHPRPRNHWRRRV